MATITIRNLDDATVAELKRIARQNSRSLEAELRHLLSRHVGNRQKMAMLRERSRQLAALTPDVPQTDSVLLLREDRDR